MTDLVSRDRIRALTHLTALESGFSSPQFGVAPWLFTKIGLFPLSPPDPSLPLWTRTTPYGSISITRGVAPNTDGQPVLTDYPSGGIPRLFLIDLATEVNRLAKNGVDPKYIDLTTTLNRYVTERLGLSRGSRNKQVLGQIEAVARSTITFTASTSEKARGGKWLTAWDLPRVAQKWSLWLPEQQPFRGFEPYLELSDEFVNMVLNGDSPPVRRDLLAKLTGKPMAFDILLWLSSVTFLLRAKRIPSQFFKWDELCAQFTHYYNDVANFRKRWQRALEEAIVYYPDINLEIIRGTRSTRGGVIARRSPLLISR